MSYDGERDNQERVVAAAASEGMERAASTLTAQEWEAKFFAGLPRFIEKWTKLYGQVPFSIHDMYANGLPSAPGGGDCAGPTVKKAVAYGLIVRVGTKKSIVTSQHREVSAYLGRHS